MKTQHLHLSSMRFCLWMGFEVLLMVTCKGASHSLCWTGAYVLQEPAVSIQWWRQHVLPEIGIPVCIKQGCSRWTVGYLLLALHKQMYCQAWVLA